MKSKIFSVLLSLLFLCLITGCDSTDQNIADIKEYIDNKEYEQAFSLYEVNSDNNDVKLEVSNMVENIVLNAKNEYNINNISVEDAKKSIENLNKFMSDEDYKKAIYELGRLENSKNDYTIANEYYNDENLNFALEYYKKVIEYDVNYNSAIKKIDEIEKIIEEDYKEFVISMKDKLEIKFDKIENEYDLSTTPNDALDILNKKPYCNFGDITISGKLNSDKLDLSMTLVQIIPSLVGNFDEIIFYQEDKENVVFELEDMPSCTQGNEYLGWISMYGEEELASLFFVMLFDSINSNCEKFDDLFIMLNSDKDITVRAYFTSGSNTDFIISKDSKDKMLEMIKLYKALKYDNQLINELI